MNPPDGTPGQPQDLRRRLVIRVMVATVVVVGLVAGLKWLERPEAVPPPEPGKVSSAAAISVQAPSPADPPVTGPAAGVPPVLEAHPASADNDEASHTSPAAASTAQSPDAATASAPGPARADSSGPVAAESPPPPHSPTAPASAAKHRTPRGEHLQVGMFLQASNAEQLKSRLEAQGFPVYIESRVNVGPFQDRKEAERVRQQLKALGISTVLITR